MTTLMTLATNVVKPDTCRPAVNHHGAVGSTRSPAEAPEQQVVHVNNLFGGEKADVTLHRLRGRHSPRS
jgi:hypothetical protein